MSNNTTTNTTAVNMGSAVDFVKKTKQGHSFLFCLCDMRRAVIMLDTLGFILGVAALIFILVVGKTEVYKDYEEEVHDENGWLLEKYSFWGLFAIQCAVTLCHLSAIIGAATFTICPIIITILMDIAYAVLSGLDKNWIGLGIYVFLLYPHVVLCYELAQRIMTRDNYRSQERQSCCCV